MAVHSARQANSRGAPKALESTVLPPPIRGMDGRRPLASNDPEVCVYAYNLVPAEYGMQTREGWRIYQEDVFTASNDGGVKTIVPFRSTDPFNAGARLFAMTSEGIWDTTADGGTPTLKLAWANPGGDAGWGVFTQYVDGAGNETVLHADEENGLHEYDPVTDTWALMTGITGVDVTKICFVVVHKQRLWLVERDTATAYYMPVGAKTGAATAFSFGTKFSHGGDLVGLFNWTLDSGAGVNDLLVAVSRAGDVLPWSGEDPSSADTWSNVGTFFIGAVPWGRRIADDIGGDLLLLSDVGVTSISELLQGEAHVTGSDSVAGKISNYIRRDMALYIDAWGWSITHDPNEGLMLISTPVRRNGEYLQYRVNTVVEGWAFWREVPGQCFHTWLNHVMVGTADGRVLRMDSNSDGVSPADPVGTPVSFSLLCNFLTMGSPARFKYGEFIRPDFVGTQLPVYESAFLYDYEDRELTAPGASPEVPDPAWDLSLWDSAFWTDNAEVSGATVQGSWGCGRTLGVALRGNATARVRLVSIDVMWRAGGEF